MPCPPLGKPILNISLFAFPRAACACILVTAIFSVSPANRNWTVRAKGISLRIDSSGRVNGLKLPGGRSFEVFQAETRLDGQNPPEKLRIRPLARGVEIERTEICSGRRCRITEQFEPAGRGIRWQVQILANGPAWTTPITTTLRFSDPAKRRTWMAWNDPEDSHAGLGMGDDKTPWHDPLTTEPFRDRTLSYGATPNTNFWSGDIATLPMLSEFDPGEDSGVSLIESPQDAVPFAQLESSATGSLSFKRLNRRLGEGKVCRFQMFLVPHAADPRAALGCFVDRFPSNFEPPNSAVASFGGCGAYSGDERQFDAATTSRLRRMDFKTMWKLSDDYAYMGMFIPPVNGPDERWQRVDDSGSPPNYKPAWTSVRRLNDYARTLKSNGFHLLSYFNAIEFGHDMVSPRFSGPSPGHDLWKNPVAYLHLNAPNAPLRPDGSKPEGAWQGGWALDPGDPGYLRHLLDQADRHIRWLPAAEGICIDRVDYMNQYNDLADDGVTFHNGRKSRALVTSWGNMMDALGPKMHSAGKVIFANLMDPRIDLARRLDGVYAEFGNQPTVVNGLSFLCLEKPLLAWTRNEDQLNDAYFQRELYLGAFPTAPYPTNNHCVQPSPEHDRWYLDYGPLFAALQGRKWVLLPHAVEAEGHAKANLFSVPGGYVVSVVFAEGKGPVLVRLNRLPGLGKHSHFAVLLPGKSTKLPLSASIHGRSAVLRVPVERGCAVVTIRR